MTLYRLLRYLYYYLHAVLVCASMPVSSAIVSLSSHWYESYMPVSATSHLAFSPARLPLIC